MHVCHVRRHGFDPYRHSLSEWNGQPHWLSRSDIDGGGIRVTQQRGSMVPLTTQGERWKTLS
ncbi:unnamed protein product [Hymenolepis diminuta]|uniref:Uncharacterized protein n=1 Tax=Hymenolepis diminuta TaxID=6216 RepID=A0A564ZAK9_HYMDI|nr:unnamed protein product [Hymenolepis diminuta]VUZ56400.1 unnamed protein product [Hymenolepis diminuta]VUZ57377.1 unnamed protein product [Hymenolepis diminuta]